MDYRAVIDSFGFDAVGVVPYDVLHSEREHLDRWLSDGCHGGRLYMEQHRREDPAIVLDNCKSLIVILFAPQRWNYHTPIRRELKKLLAALQTVDPTLEGRGVVDSAPVMERAWARRAGLGWIGRNSLLINERFGSDFNIGILLVNKEIGGGVVHIAEDRCVSCDAPCLDACPSGALRGDRTVDCRVCLSALSQLDRSVGGDFGCRICQDVCPYNGSSQKSVSPKRPLLAE